MNAPLAAQPEPPPHSSAFALPAGFISANLRGGYRKYDGADKYQHVERGSMVTYGGTAGKRFALKNRRVRFQASLEALWGSTEEGVYDYEDAYGAADKAYEHIKLSALGIQTDMHLLFPDKTRAYFLSVGPGIHRSSFSFSLRRKNNEVLFKGGNINTVSPSFNIGAGVEHTLNQHRAAALAYNFRIWNPVNYIETGELFPMGVQYREFFYTHSLHIQILLPGTKKGKFH